MPVAVDTSTPGLASNTSSTTRAITSPSFTPVGGSLLLITWGADSGSASDSPPNPSITDSLGSHLTYTLIQYATPSSAGANVGGQAAIWTAVVPASPSAMTVTVTNNDATSGASASSLQVWVLTGASTSSPIGGSGIGKLSPAATGVTQNYTASVTGGMGFLAGSDWDADASKVTAGAGCSVISDYPGTAVLNFFAHRTAADDTAGVQNTLSGTLNTADTALWAWADVTPQYHTAALAAGIGMTAAPAGSAAGNANLAAGLSLSTGATIEPVATLPVGSQITAVPNIWFYAGQLTVTYLQYLGAPGTGALTVTPGEYVPVVGRASGYPWTLTIPPPDGRWVTYGQGGHSYGVPLVKHPRSSAPARSRAPRFGDRSRSGYQVAGAHRIPPSDQEEQVIVSRP